MQKKKILLQLLLELVFAFLISVVFYFYMERSDFVDSKIAVQVTFMPPRPGTYELFYTNKPIYDQQHSLLLNVNNATSFQTITFELPADSMVSKFRFDFDNVAGITFLKEITLGTGTLKLSWSGDQLLKDFVNNDAIGYAKPVHDYIEYNIVREDAYMLLNKDISKEYQEMMNVLKKERHNKVIVLCLILFVVMLVLLRISGLSEKLLSGFSDPNKALLLVFMTVLFLPVFNMLFGIFAEPHSYEKRELNKMAVYGETKFADYTEKYNSYFNDHFGLRTACIKMNSYFKYLVLHSIPGQKVILGKDKWLFPIEAFDPIPPAEILAIEKNVEEISLRLKSKGIDYYVIIVPEKSYMYSEKYPEHTYRKGDFKIRTDQVIDYLKRNKNIKIIDLRALLQETKANTPHELYYPTDTHWNMYAAAIAYNYVMSEIGKDHPDVQPEPLKNYEFVKTPRQGGDLCYTFEAPELFPMSDWVPVVNNKPSYSIQHLDSAVPRKYTNINEQCKNRKKMLLFHDSYALYWRQQATQDFYQSVSYWTNFYQDKMVEEEKPNIVIHEMVSRFTLNLRNP